MPGSDGDDGGGTSVVVVRVVVEEGIIASPRVVVPSDEALIAPKKQAGTNVASASAQIIIGECMMWCFLNGDNTGDSSEGDGDCDDDGSFINSVSVLGN